MTLGRRILLLGIAAVASVCWVLSGQYETYAERSRELLAVSRNIGIVDTLALAAHELQKERGLTTLALSGAKDAAVADQIVRTDAALAKLSAASDNFRSIGVAVAQLRAAVAARALTPVAARNRYTMLLQDLLDEMTRLVRQPAMSLAGADVAAHAHLVAVKEYLGQMRATLGYWIEDGRDGQDNQRTLARLKGLFEEERRRFAITASPSLRQSFDAGLAGREALATLDAVSKAIAQNHPAFGLEASTWWAMATTAMEHLRWVEDRSLHQIERQAEDSLIQLRDTRAYIGAMALAGGLIALLLAAFNLHSLLRAIGRLLSGIEGIVKNQAFHLRIPEEGKPDEIGRLSQGVNRLLDVTERLLRESRRHAITDPLTGIHNRIGFAKTLADEALRKRRNGTPMAAILFDVDHFTGVNNGHGHDVGDKTLVTLSGLVARKTRASDYFCRWGDDKFVLLLRDDPCDVALLVAEKIRGIVAATDFPPVGRLTCSFGITFWSDDDSDVSLFNRAGSALHNSKYGGGNRVCCEVGLATACPGYTACGSRGVTHDRCAAMTRP